MWGCMIITVIYVVGVVYFYTLVRAGAAIPPSR
jgi:hypothetical protein